VTATVTLLYGRALHVTIGAIHAAIPGKWSQDFTTALAIIKKLTGLRGHLFSLGVTTFGADDG
jgi:hypothetical protein